MNSQIKQANCFTPTGMERVGYKKKTIYSGITELAYNVVHSYNMQLQCQWHEV